MKKIAIILIYISLFICTLRGQKIFYVNHPIISNSNYNYHNLQELHNKLIQEYGSTVNEDITIEVYDDWYPESTLLWKINGTPDHKVTVIGDKNGQGSRPIFYGSSIDTVSQPYGAPALIINAEYVTISNIHFKSFYGATHYKPGHKKYNKCQHRVALTINGNYNSIKECKFSDFTGIGPEAAISIPIDRKYNRVAQCDFANLNGHIFLHAVYINGGDSNLVINNYVEDCSGGPFKVKNMAINNK
ncbi:MAG: hypothetical protein K9M80_02330, partial [Candidatus Marinimicrobia bacterium]|nr:hypothetical protein [Candidatus Neomarinimicrobiota bacterium]